MYYKLDFDTAMRKRFPNLYEYRDSKQFPYLAEYGELVMFQHECLAWLGINLHMHYTFEVFTDESYRDDSDNYNPMPIEYITFRYEEDMLMFRLKFGI